MGVTIEQLRVFRTVLEHGRVNIAAAALGVSQPSVSQQMRRLEEAVGFALTEVRDGRLVPTARGEHVRDIAELVVGGADRLKELSEEARLGTHAALTVGANTTGGMYFVPEVIRRFRSDQPGVRVTLRIGSVNDLASSVLGGVCDVGIAGGPITAREFATETLFLDRLPLVAAPGDAFARRRTVQLADLKTRQFILPSVGSRTRLVVEQALRAVGVELDNVIEYPDTEHVKKAVEANLGIAYLSREGVRRELQHHYLEEVTVKGFGVERPFQAFWLKERPRHRLVSLFIESARLAAQSPLRQQR